MKKININRFLLLLMAGSLFLLMNGCEKEENTVTDVEGNVYAKVHIGMQTWMGENLRTTTYNDGTAIPLITDNTAWASATTPGYCWYNNDEATYGDEYGILYNWYALHGGKLCPDGWHVGTEQDKNDLINFLGGAAKAGGLLKEGGTEHWADPNYGAIDKYGFTALPAGCRELNGSFHSLNYGGGWWCANEYDADRAYYWYINNNNSQTVSSTYYKRAGLSVRCMKN